MFARVFSGRLSLESTREFRDDVCRGGTFPIAIHSAVLPNDMNNTGVIAGTAGSVSGPVELLGIELLEEHARRLADALRVDYLELRNVNAS